MSEAESLLSGRAIDQVLLCQTGGEMSEDGDAHGGQDDAPAPPTPGPSSQPESQAESQADPAPQTHTRRWVLAGAGAVLLAGGAGVGAAFLQGRGTVHHRPPRPPAPLLAAAAAERALIADLDATTGGDAAVRDVIRAARADHAAHLSALEGLLARYPQPTAAHGTPAAAGSPTPPPPRGTARTRAQLRAAEHAAAGAAARRAAALDGPTAALLASIAACEAVHAELFA